MSRLPPRDPLRIVVVGAMVPGSRIPQRVRAMRAAGHRVETVDTAPPGRTYDERPSLRRRIRHRLRMPADETGANGRLAASARGTDIVWIENVPTIRRATLEAVRRAQPRARIVWYAEDDMMSRRHGSVWLDRSLDLFDLWVTTKSFNAAPHEMPARGVRRVLFVNNSYDPEIHRPVAVDEADRARWGAEVSFVGTYEAPRAASLRFLAENGIGVRVWGNGWERFGPPLPGLRIERRAAYDDDFARILCASRINLCFLRKANRDLQTTRSVEIPACGAFMLHERNAEITELFAEDRHAAYFGTNGELLAACRRWLADEAGRSVIAAAGLRRVAEARLSHRDMVERVLLEACRVTPAGQAA